jgi:ferredoxin
MLKDKIIDRFAASADLIGIDRSRCLRMRFNKNECSQCTGVCRSSAISIREDVSIDFRLCSECMLCVSACPSECFDIKSFDFFSVLARLRKIKDSVPVPVLGCNMRHDVQAHVKTPCLGFLSEEHLLALSVFPDSVIHINMTECGDCKNSFIADKVMERAGRLEKECSFNISEKIVMIKEKKILNYGEVACGRRGFFSAVKNLTFLQAAEIFENNNGVTAPQAYSAKKVPLKRDLLNRVYVFLNGKGSGLMKGCYYTINLTEDCNNCFACIGMCPAGALKISKDDAAPVSRLLFNTSLCNGCGLCRDFCFNNALHIKKGFSGMNPLEFAPLNRGIKA